MRICLFLVGSALFAADGEELFRQTVKPALEQNCFGCHAGAQTLAKLDLRTREGLLRGGENGPAIVPGSASKSLLVASVERTGELRMPPGDRALPAEVVAAIRRWVDEGAPWSEADARPQWAYKAEDLWAFRPLQRVAPPAPGNPVDAFLDAKLRERGVKPAPPADRRTLIRRATFDLTGLPPTPEEVDAFLSDKSPDAFARVVDRLLASARYGERWARHWLDVVRYGDSDGYSNDFERPHAWRYRDYVIRSFNSDKPYDRFVLEQVAGDELDPGRPESLIATGFLRMGPWEHTGMAVAAVTRQMFLDDVTHNTATAFLGLTLGCARCHDHKFDPIPTRDYYRLQAVFATTEFAALPVPFLETENTAGFDEALARAQELVRRTEAKIKSHGDPKALPPEEFARNNAYRKRLEIYKRAAERYRPLAFGVESKGAAETFVLTSGNLKSPGDKVAPGVLTAALYRKNEDVPAAPAGRRLQLARWIADPENPLTARVMANRIWTWHFNQGLAGTPNNFGKMGKKPTHPELLDYLAAYFIEHGWSVKQMHRLIMLSNAYRRAPDGGDDPLLASFPPRRLEAEELRDSMLAVSGELSPDTGGPGTFPEINEDVAGQPRLIMGQISPAYTPSPTRRERNRRSIYTFQKRSIPDPLVESFNAANPGESCERREATTVPTQVFTLWNSRYVHNRALAFAARVAALSGDPAVRVRQAVRLAFGRRPSASEHKRLSEHLARMTEWHRENAPPERAPRKPIVRSLVHELTGQAFSLQEEAGPAAYEEDLHPSEVPAETRALADVALVLLNANEFVYVF